MVERNRANVGGERTFGWLFQNRSLPVGVVNNSHRQYARRPSGMGSFLALNPVQMGPFLHHIAGDAFPTIVGGQHFRGAGK